MEVWEAFVLVVGGHADGATVAAVRAGARMATVMESVNWGGIRTE